MDKESYISVFVKEMRVQLCIGLYDRERGVAQPVDISIELFTDLSYLSGVDTSKIIDYSKVYDSVMAWEGRDHVDLIETYLKELFDIGFAFERVSSVRASISKPDILTEAKAAGLSGLLHRSDWQAASF